MPKIYLSPSTQEKNLYINGGTEEQYMNLVADALVPYLDASGIAYTRNTPEMTAASSLAQSKQEHYDLYVSLHSNAAPESKAGQVRGSDMYYYPTSAKGKRFADLLVKNFKTIYPEPSLVKAVPTTKLGEVAKSIPPAVLLEVAFHDNEQDATWIKNSIDQIAWATALSITEYFGLPLATPQQPQAANVDIGSGRLNIRAKPNTNSAILARAPKGAPITVLGVVGDWYVVKYEGITGYTNGKYIKI